MRRGEEGLRCNEFLLLNVFITAGVRGWRRRGAKYRYSVRDGLKRVRGGGEPDRRKQPDFSFCSFFHTFGIKQRVVSS